MTKNQPIAHCLAIGKGKNEIVIRFFSEEDRDRMGDFLMSLFELHAIERIAEFNEITNGRGQIIRDEFYSIALAT